MVCWHWKVIMRDLTFLQRIPETGASGVSLEAGSFLWCKEMFISCMFPFALCFLKDFLFSVSDCSVGTFWLPVFWWEFLLFLRKSWNLTGCHGFRMCACKSSSNRSQRLKKKFFFYWRIVVLRCSVSFCCTAKWISYMHTYIPSLLDFLPI